jgi:hypothetical protein
MGWSEQVIENLQVQNINSRATRAQTTASTREQEILYGVVINRQTEQNYTFKTDGWELQRSI